MQTTDRAPHLRRVMGFADLVLFFVVTGFGLMWVSTAAKAGAAGLTYWMIGGLTFFLPLGVCVLALSNRFPGEGGLYLWSRQSFGDFAGFMTGWCYWFANLAYLPFVLYFVAGTALSVRSTPSQDLSGDPRYFVAASLIALALVTLVNLVGLDIGKWLHNAGALGTWLPAVALTGLATVAWMRHGSVTDLSWTRFVPNVSVRDAVVWAAVVFSLTGLEAAAILGDEIRDVRRRMAPALTLGAVLVIVTNVVTTLAILVVVTPEQAQAGGSELFMHAYSMASQRAGVSGWIPLIASLVAIGHLGKVGAWSAAGARLPFVAGLDQRLPAAFGRLHPRWGTPHVALMVQAAIIAVLIVLGQAGTTAKGAYDVFLSMTLIPTFIPFLYLFSAAMKDPQGMALVTGTRIAAAFGILSTTSAMLLAVVPPEDDPNPVLYIIKVVGLAIVLIGAGAFLFFLSPIRRTAASTEEPGKPVC
jgi:amino acid transporter